MCCHKYPHGSSFSSVSVYFILKCHSGRGRFDGRLPSNILFAATFTFSFFPPSLVPTSVFDPDLGALTRVSVWKPNTRIKRGGRWRSDNAGQCEERGPRANWQQGVKVSLTYSITCSLALYILFEGRAECPSTHPHGGVLQWGGVESNDLRADWKLSKVTVTCKTMQQMRGRNMKQEGFLILLFVFPQNTSYFKFTVRTYAQTHTFTLLDKHVHCTASLLFSWTWRHLAKR